MLTAIAGYYDHGKIILNEQPLANVKMDVIVTFLHNKSESYQNLIIGSQVYKIPKRLKTLAKAINDSRNICLLEQGWDEDKAKQIAEPLWIISARFLIEYALHLYDNADALLEIPEINPVPNGTIDLSWRTKNARLLINIREEKNETLAYYYGDLYNDRFPVKGYVTTKNVTLHLVQWMKDSLTV